MAKGKPMFGGKKAAPFVKGGKRSKASPNTGTGKPRKKKSAKRR